MFNVLSNNRPLQTQGIKFQGLTKDTGKAIPQAQGADSFHKTNDKAVRFAGGLDDVVGMDSLKREIKTQFINPLKRSLDSNFKNKSNVVGKNPGGLLLYGPPGTGKTFLAEKAAEEVKDLVHFVEISPEDRADHHYGVVEKVLAEKFDEAASHTNSIVFIDEFDSLALPVKTGSVDDRDYQANRRAAILMHLQKAPSRGTIVMGTSNKHPDDLDQAIVRAGRMSIKLQVSNPDQKAREGLFKQYIRQSLIPNASFPISDKHIEKLAKQTEDCSAATVIDIVNRAVNEAYEDQKLLDMDCLESALRKELKKPEPVSNARTTQAVRQINATQARNSQHRQSFQMSHEGTYFTNLMNASSGTDIHLVRILLNEGGNPNQVITHEELGQHTPLSCAATSCNDEPDIVRLLLQRGANPNYRHEPSGMTALMYARSSGNKNIAAALIEGGAREDITDNEGRTAEHYKQQVGSCVVM